MPTRITQIEKLEREEPALNTLAGSVTPTNNFDIADPATEGVSGVTVFKVEGSLCLNDAKLLEKICRDVSTQTGRSVALDLASLSNIDNDSAAVLCRMKREYGVKLEGLHLFVKKVVELAEESEKAAGYLPTRQDAA